MTLFLAALILLAPNGSDLDSDKDGLSDFAEVHKYGTDPKKTDSDGDGIADGDWLERREFAYTVRSVVQVLRPVTVEYLNDDYQDVRVLDEGELVVELEVIHYPFNRVAEAITSNDDWRNPPKEVQRWLKPGPTSDWDAGLQKKLLAELKAAGIDVAQLNDRQVVEQVSKWLMARAEYHDFFTTFLTSFDGQGKPFVKPSYDKRVARDLEETEFTLREIWDREISAKGMFENRSRGSCTSSAIYLNGCLRAVGIPTRTVLCIPLIDASDSWERDLIPQRIQHHGVREIVAKKADLGTNSWTSHTFNEVWIGGRWCRLNYSTLGQNILDTHYLGLMTHIATFDDWADANMADTVGRQRELPIAKTLFGGANPYSALSIGDAFGEHCKMENPAPETLEWKFERVLWTDSPDLPQGILENCAKSGRFGLIAVIPTAKSSRQVSRVIHESPVRLGLRADKRPTIELHMDHGCIWNRNGFAYVYIPLKGAAKQKLVPGADYRLAALESGELANSWEVDVAVPVRN